MPERRRSRLIIRMPVRILPARNAVQIREKIDLILAAESQQTVKIAESLFFPQLHILIIQKQSIVKRHANQVDAGILQKLKVLLRTEGTDEIIKEPGRLFRSENLCKSFLHLFFRRWDSKHKVFQIQPAPDAQPGEPDALSLINKFISLYSYKFHSSSSVFTHLFPVSSQIPASPSLPAAVL